MIQYINEKIRNDDWTTTIKSFISYLESTTDDQWCIDIVRSADMSKNCLVGHFCEFKSDWDTSESFSWFEENGFTNILFL